MDLQPYQRGLSAPEAIDRAEAAEALGRMGTDAAPAAVELIRAANDTSETVRDWVANALENLGPPPADLEPQLIELAGDHSADRAYWGVTLLGRLEAPSQETIATLTEIVAGERKPIVRQRAAWALGNFGPAARAALEPLRAASQEADKRLSRLAARAVEQIEAEHSDD